MKSFGSMFGSIGIVVVASGVIAGLASCGGSKSPPKGGGTTSVYVIQNPTTFGTGSGTILQFSATATGSASPMSTITAPANTSFGKQAPLNCVHDESAALSSFERTWGCSIGILLKSTADIEMPQ